MEMEIMDMISIQQKDINNLTDLNDAMRREYQRYSFITNPSIC